MKGIGKKYRKSLALVLNKKTGIISSKIVSDILGTTLSESSRLLSRWSKAGWLERIKRGVYVPRPIDTLSEHSTLEDPILVAEKLFSPGYVGGFTAIKHWDLSEQIFETISYFTTKKIKHKEVVLGDTKILLKHIAPYRLFGTKTIWFQNTKVKISDPSKTIVDLLDEPQSVGGMTVVFDLFQEYKESEYYDFKLLVNYGEQNLNMTVFKRLGFMMETKGLLTQSDESILKQKISKGLSQFDPSIECKYVNKKWNLKIPSNWKKEYDRKK